MGCPLDHDAWRLFFFVTHRRTGFGLDACKQWCEHHCLHGHSFVKHVQTQVSHSLEFLSPGNSCVGSTTKVNASFVFSVRSQLYLPKTYARVHTHMCSHAFAHEYYMALCACIWLNTCTVKRTFANTCTQISAHVHFLQYMLHTQQSFTCVWFIGY